MSAAATTFAPFRHEALFYRGDDGFVEAVAPFVRGGVESGEPTLVVVDRDKIAWLRAALDGAADEVMFADMHEVGANPGRIIPAWREFVARHGGPGRRLRGVGEPISDARAGPELVECHRHESLLNLAFADTPGFWLVCPYDTERLDDDVLAEARRNHPSLVADGARLDSDLFDQSAPSAPFTEPLPRPPAKRSELAFVVGMLDAVRDLVADHARRAGLVDGKAADLMLAVDELASNSLRHGGGRGLLRVWSESSAIVCEVTDGGRIEDPLVGRRPPSASQTGGFGMWLVNHLCDLVQVRQVRHGSVVRVHMRLG